MSGQPGADRVAANSQAFHKLKEEFKDKPICFVSISIDADEAAWRAKIERSAWMVSN